MSTALVTDLTIFVLALLVGIEVIGKVPATLHTPLMSAANSIHGIVLAGALLIGLTAHNAVGYVLAFIAAFFAAANVVGGYVVTGRMLKMFRRKAAPGTQRHRVGRCHDGRGHTGRRRRQRTAAVDGHGRGSRAGRAGHPVVGGRSVNTFTTNIQLVYVLAAACFVVGLHLMNSPATARRGNQVSTAGMAIAVIVTLVLLIHDGSVTGIGWTVLIVGALLGSVAGLYSARTVQMTAMPQLVSMFNAVGGGAAALVAVYEYIARRVGARRGARHHVGLHRARRDHRLGDVHRVAHRGGQAAGRHHRQPVIFKGGRALNVALAVIALGTGAFMFTTASLPALLILVLASLAFGVMMVLPIGGADMPVVISLLNAFTGTAVAMAGFVVGNWALIVAGRAGRRVRRHPHQADGRRDEPFPGQHHRRRLRHRRHRGRGRGGR